MLSNEIENIIYMLKLWDDVNLSKKESTKWWGHVLCCRFSVSQLLASCNNIISSFNLITSKRLGSHIDKSSPDLSIASATGLLHNCRFFFPSKSNLIFKLTIFLFHLYWIQWVLIPRHFKYSFFYFPWKHLLLTLFSFEVVNVLHFAFLIL